MNIPRKHWLLGVTWKPLVGQAALPLVCTSCEEKWFIWDLNQTVHWILNEALYLKIPQYRDIRTVLITKIDSALPHYSALLFLFKFPRLRVNGHNIVTPSPCAYMSMPPLVFTFSTRLNGDCAIDASITSSLVTLAMHLFNNFLRFRVGHFAEDNVFTIKPLGWGESDEKSKSAAN